MIRTFRHRGLKRLFERGDRGQVSADHLSRIEDILGRLDIADSPHALALPGYNLHRLRGDLGGFWSVRVSGNRRIIFRFEDREAFDVDLVDYH